MKRLSTGQQRRSTAQERAEWISRYRSSGQSQRQFAQEHGLALSTLQQWLYRERHERRPEVQRTIFQEIPVSPLLPAISTAWAVEIVTSGGTTLRLREALPARDLARLLRG